MENINVVTIEIGSLMGWLVLAWVGAGATILIGLVLGWAARDSST